MNSRMKIPPNILWIQADEMRAAALGFRTPHLDALAARGTSWTNHHVQSPVCVPSRVAELTGRYAHETGILDNSTAYSHGVWPAGCRTFPELFAEAGYLTASIGKYHEPYRPIWIENTEFELFENEAWYSRLVSADDAAHDVIHLHREPQSLILAGRYPGARTPSAHVTDLALGWLSRHNVADIRRPFLLRVSYLAPHTPVLPATEFLRDDGDGAPMESAMRADQPAFEQTSRLRNRVHDAGDLRRIRASYNALVAEVDAQVGRLVAKLAAMGELERTIIAFTSDHGVLLGEHGLFQKMVFHDEVTRVPFVMAGPGIPAGQRVTGLSEGIDLGRTLLGACGIGAEFPGRDLLRAPLPREVIGEIVEPRPIGLVRRSWIRTDEWSLDVTTAVDGLPATDADGQLVSVGETVNRWREPACAGVIQELLARLRARLIDGAVPAQRGQKQVKFARREGTQST